MLFPFPGASAGHLEFYPCDDLSLSRPSPDQVLSPCCTPTLFTQHYGILARSDQDKHMRRLPCPFL
jgi:hypothetical protein